MSPDDAFLQAILENPDDDGPRLMYADWLTEQGNPRGEFIRVQCELHTLAADDARRPHLRERESQLLNVFGHLWRGPLPLTATGSFRRGFLEYASLTGLRQIQMVETLLQVHPLQSLRLSGGASVASCLVRLGSCPVVCRLRELDLTGLELPSEPLLSLLLNPGLCHLRRLRIRLRDRPRSESNPVIRCTQLDHLEELDLSGSPLANRGCVLLTGSPHRTRLTQLGLARTGTSSRGVMALAESPILVNLTHLDLSGNYLASPGALALARSPYLSRLQRLDVSGNSIREPERRSLRDRFGESVCIF
jgi:uncharacterized protein (TIGR02996 family)